MCLLNRAETVHVTVVVELEVISQVPFTCQWGISIFGKFTVRDAKPLRVPVEHLPWGRWWLKFLSWIVRLMATLLWSLKMKKWGHEVIIQRKTQQFLTAVHGHVSCWPCSHAQNPCQHRWACLWGSVPSRNSKGLSPEVKCSFGMLKIILLTNVPKNIEESLCALLPLRDYAEQTQGWVLSVWCSFCMLGRIRSSEPTRTVFLVHRELTHSPDTECLLRVTHCSETEGSSKEAKILAFGGFSFCCSL